MSTAQDQFVAFVDMLATQLDDHEASGADLAARMHLSRFHFDRIVSSVGGETPARFRRRVLASSISFSAVSGSLLHIPKYQASTSGWRLTFHGLGC